jgi:hypothetical protein
MASVDADTYLGHILFCKNKILYVYPKFSETDIINMLEILIYNIFVMFGGRVFQQTVGIHMCSNRAPLLAHLFLYWYEAGSIQELLKKDEKKLARFFNITCRYMDDNSRFRDFVDDSYPIQLK